MNRVALYNGRVRTPFGYAGAVLVEGQTIAAVGNNEEILAAAKGAERIDLGGRLLLPGFVDGHMHFLACALAMDQLNLTGCRSVEELRGMVRTFRDDRKLAPGEWIVGRGWNHEHFADGRIPTKEDLDDVTPGNPVLLVRVCGHVATLNSLGLRTLDISRESRFSGGVVDLDERGEPTGVLRETAVQYARMKTGTSAPDRLRSALVRAGADLAKVGLTSLCSDDLGSVQGDFRALFDLYLGLERDGAMPVRVTEQLLLKDRGALDDFLSTGWRTGDGTPFFHVGPLKILTDGSMGGRTALLREEYSDMKGVLGVPIHGQDELQDLIWTAHRAGMQIATHAIGDGALDLCLDGMEKALVRAPRKARHYIVHCQMGDMGQYRRMAHLGIGAAIQPPFVPSDRPMALKRIGEARALSGYAWKTLLNLGIFLSGGSDAPVESFSPLWGIYTAVTRQDEKGEPEGGWNPSQKLTVEEAVDLYTAGGAYSSFDEHHKGTIEAGKLADMVALDRDIFTIPEEEIRDVRVSLTLTGGRCTHRAL